MALDWIQFLRKKKLYTNVKNMSISSFSLTNFINEHLVEKFAQNDFISFLSHYYLHHSVFSWKISPMVS